MITDSRVLQAGHQPREMVHRNSELTALSTALQPVVRDRSDVIINIFGPSGAGKTTLARTICDQLRLEVPAIETGAVDCMASDGTRDTLTTLLNSIRPRRGVVRPGLKRETILEEFRRPDSRLVCLIDEVASLPDRSLLSDLAAIDGVSLLCLDVDQHVFFSSLDRQLANTLRAGTFVLCEGYTQAELQDIIATRAAAGLEPDSVTSDALAAMADEAAGDARLGIALLREAAEQCHTSGDDRIDTEVVERCLPRAREVVAKQTIENLGSHQRLLYEYIREAGEIKGSALHAKYERDVSTPKTRRQRRRYLAGLERYGLIESAGATKARRYRQITPTDRS